MDAKEIKKPKKNIDILQVAANDKENLSRKAAPKKKLALSNRRMKIGKKDGKNLETENRVSVEMKNNINKFMNENKLKGKTPEIVIAADLINDSPSEKYWEKLAESRRVALESALKENINLNNKLSEIEYENARLKEMLSEAQTLVEVLTEMLESNKEEGNDELHKDEESFAEESNLDNSSENDSFQSCI